MFHPLTSTTEMKKVKCEWCEKKTPKNRRNVWSIVSDETFKHLYWLCNACYHYGTGVNTLEMTRKTK